MKVLSVAGVAITAMGAVLGSSCEPASVYMIQNSKGHHVSKESPMLDLDQTQLVLSDVSGTSRFHSVSNAEDARVVNSMKHKASLFSKKPHNSILIVVDNVKNGDLLDVKPTFKIDKSPDCSFFSDFIEQTKQELVQLSGKVSHMLKDGVAVLTHHFDAVKRGVEEIEVPIEGLDMDDSADQAVLGDISTIKSLEYNVIHDDGMFVHLSSLAGVDAEKYPVALNAMKRALMKLIDQAENYKLTVVAVPENTCATIHRVKRDDDKKQSGVVKPVLGGYKDKQTCEDKTNKCSGHGECVKIHNGKYACACKASYDEDRKKTTRWGGDACQKKDVSIEFQLFFWTGLGILFVTAYALQLLYSIGSDPLPGVLNTAKSS